MTDGTTPEELGVEPGERMRDAHRRIPRGEALYAEPVDPWADHEITATPLPASSGLPYAARPVSPPPPPPPPPPTPPPPTPALPPTLLEPRRRRLRWVEVVLAVLAPILCCSLGTWLYFTYVALQRGKRRHYVVAGVYFVLSTISITLLVIDPSPLDSTDLTVTEQVGGAFALVLMAVAVTHGAILAATDGDTRRDRSLRRLARQFAAINPDGARQAGIGRPDLLRTFDDGGLVDLNHAPAKELARLDGLTPHTAHRIEVDRYERGPYRSPEELLHRGLVPRAALRRAERWLICIPPG